MTSDDDADPPDLAKKEHAHLINVEKLIVHKYSNHAALLKKADKIAREIINEDMRDGEYLQALKPGRYYLHCPRMTPEAGELRCAVLTEKLYRAVRDLNPAAQKLDAGPDQQEEPAPKTKPAVPPAAAAAPPPKRPAPATDASDGRTAEMRRASSAALSAMSGPGTLSREEMLTSPLGQQLQASLTLELSPMWYVAQRVIIGHDCIPTADGVSLRHTGLNFRESNLNPVEIRAIIDTVTYERVATQLRKNQSQGTMGLLVCPVHATTLAQPKFVGAFLAAGTALPPEARNYLIFLVKEFVAPISRIKVREAAGYLKPRARGLLVELPLSGGKVSPDFKEFGFYGTRATITGSGKSETALLKLMDEFAEHSENAKLRCTVDGLESTSLTVGAVAAGYAYLSGPAIQKQSGDNTRVQDFDVDTLFV